MRFILPQHDPAVQWIDWPLTAAGSTVPAQLDPPSARATLALRLPVDISDTSLETLAPLLPRVAVVGLSFGKWTDGRGYSVAWLLRRRHGFSGELRALGEVLVDMVPLLQRCGFDAVELRGDQSLQAAERSLGFFHGHYQADAIQARTAPFAQPQILAGSS